MYNPLGGTHYGYAYYRVGLFLMHIKNLGANVEDNIAMPMFDRKRTMLTNIF